MENETFRSLLTTLITAQSIIVAVIVIWKQYWIHIYQIYTDENRRRGYKYNDIWHVSFAGANLSWAAIAAIISVVLFIWSIIALNSSLILIVFGLGLGLSIYSIGIIISAMFLSTAATGKKARENIEWRSLKINEIKGILGCVLNVLAGKNKRVEELVDIFGAWVFFIACGSIASGIIISIFIL